MVCHHVSWKATGRHLPRASPDSLIPQGDSEIHRKLARSSRIWLCHDIPRCTVTPMPRKTHTSLGARLLKIDDAASQLRLSRSTVYRLINSGALPSVHVGDAGFARIRQSDLDTYVASTLRGGDELPAAVGE